MATKKQTRQRLANTRDGKIVVNGYNFGVMNYGPFTQNVNHLRSDHDDSVSYENIPSHICMGDMFPCVPLTTARSPKRKRKKVSASIKEVPATKPVYSNDTTSESPKPVCRGVKTALFTACLGVAVVLAGSVIKYIKIHS